MPTNKILSLKETINSLVFQNYKRISDHYRIYKKVVNKINKCLDRRENGEE